MKAAKFLCIALLACGMMFVSCKKDNPKPDDNNNQTENPGGNGGGTVTPEPTEVITITFDGETWTPGHISQNYDYPYQGQQFCIYDLWISEESYYPSADGTLVLDATADQPYRMNYYKETGYNLNTTDGGQIAVGDWAWLGSNYNDPKTITGMAFDATTLVASFKVVAPMLDVLERFQNQNEVYKDLTVEYKNVTLVMYEETSKGLNNSNIGKVTGITRSGK